MDALEDEVHLRYHRGVKPEVFYRCPTSESLGGALQTELQKNSTSLIPVELVTEFVFAAGSTITIPVAQQGNLDAFGIVPSQFPQIIPIEKALCYDIEGKDRLKIQRAVARSFTHVIQGIDGFKYTERHAWNQDGSEGTRFKYVCVDSLQNRDRHSNSKKEQSTEKVRTASRFPTFDCGGAIHFKFSAKRCAINVLYKHNPIHRDVENRFNNVRTNMGLAETNRNSEPSTLDGVVSNDGVPQKKRKHRKKEHVEESIGSPAVDLTTTIPPLTSKSPIEKRHQNGSTASPETTRPSAKKQRQGHMTGSESMGHPSTFTSVPESLPPPTPTPAKPVKGPCVRCKDNSFVCDKAKPACDQCQRELQDCEYRVPEQKTRSKSGCFNCRRRKRKCSEERPVCAYCAKINEYCELPE